MTIYSYSSKFWRVIHDFSMSWVDIEGINSEYNDFITKLKLRKLYNLNIILTSTSLGFN